MGALAAAQDYPTIGYKEAADHVGEIAWVEGKVLRTEKKPEGTYLLFSASEKFISVLIPQANIKNFDGSIQHRYTGKTVKAIGKISKYGYKLIVGVNEPKRIRIVDQET
jgi:hypothetical protein